MSRGGWAVKNGGKENELRYVISESVNGRKSIPVVGIKIEI